MSTPADRAAALTRSVGVGLLMSCLVAVASAANAGQVADLNDLSLDQLLEVPIVGASKYEQKQSEVPAAVSVITRQEIRAFGWRTLGEALASLPGIYTTYDRQYLYLGARGFGLPGDLTTRVMVAINGNRVNDPVYDSGPVGAEFPLDMDLVERIEFIPGPGGAVYGQNAMLGVVNVITRRGADVGSTELAATYQDPQSLSQGRASWGGQLGSRVDALVSISGLHADGENRFFNFGAAGASGVAVGLDDELDGKFFTRISGGPWAVDFIVGNRRKGDPTGSYLSDPLVPGQYTRDHSDLVQLQYQADVGETLQLSARAFAGRYRFRSVLSYGSAVAFPAAGNWRGTEWRLVSSAVTHHRLMLGLEAQQNTRIDQTALHLADPASDIEITNSGYRVGLYGQDEWRIRETLLATLGLRVDRNNFTGTQTSPRGALIWQATPTSTVKALYGRAYRAPNAFERDYDDRLAQVANPSLNGEKIDTLELVTDYRVGSALTVRGSVYQWTMDDLITLGIDPISELAQYQSGERVRARGLELSADKTFVANARLRGSVALQDMAYTSGAELLNSPKVLAKLNVSAPLPLPVIGLRASYELHYASARLTLDGTRLGGYALSNINLSTKPVSRGLEFSLGVSNLFDTRYRQPLADTNWQNALEQDGRSVRVTLSSRF